MKYTTCTATVTSFRTKAVCCSHCGTDYLYDMKRQGAGGVTIVGDRRLDHEELKKEAAAKAEVDVDQKLDREVDLVPCPACGCYQPDMVEVLRRDHLRWLMMVGYVVLCTAIPFLIAGAVLRVPKELFLGAGTCIAVLGAGLLAYRQNRANCFDPNAGDPRERLNLAQSRAYLPQDADRIAEDRKDQITADRRSAEGEVHAQWAQGLGLCAVLLLLGSVGLAWRGTLDLLHASSSRAWPKVAGQIHRSDRQTTRQGKSETVLGAVSYSYEVDGRAFRGSTIWFGFLLGDEAARRKYSDGVAVNVYYDPSDPALAVLQPGIKAPHSYTAALAAAGALLLGLGCAACARFKYQEYQESQRKVARLAAKRWRHAPTAASEPAATEPPAPALP
jgi:hypothetical protein